MDPTYSFFGFDASTPTDDDDDAGVLLECDGADYDAVNNETFGTAAVGGDWEENHKQLSSLTEAERVKRKRNKAELLEENIGLHIRDFQQNFDQPKNPLDNFFLENCSDKRRLFERNIGNDELSTSPGNSIWSPTHHLEINNYSNDRNLGPSLGHSLNDFTRSSTITNGTESLKSPNSYLNSLSGLHSSQSIKTVEELEGELRKQKSPQPLAFEANFSKYSSAITVEELERQLANQSLLSHNIPKNQFSSTFPNASSRPQQHNQLNSHQQFFNNGRPSPNQYLNTQHHSMNSSLGIQRPYSGNIKNGLPFHPLLNSNQYKPFPGPGANYLNNITSNSTFNNGVIGNMASNRPFNQCFNRTENNNRGFPQNGINYRKIQFEHNLRLYQQRNFMDHNHRDQNNMGSNSERVNRERRDSDAEWEEWQRIRQHDEYAGLMTPREKSWLRSIQAMQLQTDNPYQDDYYFVMCSVRQQRRREEEVMEIDGLQLLIHDKGKEGKEYEPPRLENSLGKLQVASVNAPRKIIDLHVVHLDSSHPTTSLQRDMRKHRHLLLHIEKLYIIQIELDDLERKIRSLPDCPTRDSFRSKCRQLVSKLWNSLINPHESFVQILCIKKGKTLAARLLSWVSEVEAEHLLATIIQNLSMLTKKDAHDKRLPMFWLAADRFFASLSASSLVNFGIMMGIQLKSQKNQFIPAIDSKLGLSIVLALLVRGENLWSELNEDEAWLQFLKDVVSGLCIAVVSGDVTKLQPLPSITLAASPKYPATHISRCEGVDPISLNQALEALKTCETFIIKNIPALSNSVNHFLEHKQGNEVNSQSSSHHNRY